MLIFFFDDVSVSWLLFHLFCNKWLNNVTIGIISSHLIKQHIMINQNVMICVNSWQSIMYQIVFAAAFFNIYCSCYCMNYVGFTKVIIIHIRQYHVKTWQILHEINLSVWKYCAQVFQKRSVQAFVRRASEGRYKYELFKTS